MAQAKDDRAQMTNAFSFGIPAPFINPVMTIFADLSGTLVEGLATAQRDWADFVQRRVREDVAVTRHLMNCHSIADMHQVYSQYLQTAFQHYREQSEKVVRQERERRPAPLRDDRGRHEREPPSAPLAQRPRDDGPTYQSVNRLRAALAHLAAQQARGS